MKIYAIYGDNGESYEDRWYGIMEKHIYSDPVIAEQECFKLNNPIFNPPSLSDWEKEKKDYGDDWTYEDYVEYKKDNFDRDCAWKFEVKPLELK